MWLINKTFVLLIRTYKILISPFLGDCCRFYPTCSSYAVDALNRHSLPQAVFLIIKRLLKCNPWMPGGYDPVKKQE